MDAETAHYFVMATPTLSREMASKSLAGAWRWWYQAVPVGQRCLAIITPTSARLVDNALAPVAAHAALLEELRMGVSTQELDFVVCEAVLADGRLTLLDVLAENTDDLTGWPFENRRYALAVDMDDCFNFADYIDIAFPREAHSEGLAAMFADEPAQGYRFLHETGLYARCGALETVFNVPPLG